MLRVDDIVAAATRDHGGDAESSRRGLVRRARRLRVRGGASVHVRGPGAHLRLLGPLPSAVEASAAPPASHRAAHPLGFTAPTTCAPTWATPTLGSPLRAQPQRPSLHEVRFSRYADAPPHNGTFEGHFVDHAVWPSDEEARLRAWMREHVCERCLVGGRRALGEASERGGDAVRDSWAEAAAGQGGPTPLPWLRRCPRRVLAGGRRPGPRRIDLARRCARSDALTLSHGSEESRLSVATRQRSLCLQRGTATCRSGSSTAARHRSVRCRSGSPRRSTTILSRHAQ